MRKFAIGLMIGVAGLSVISTASLAEDSTDPIKIVTNNWTSQVVLANVVGKVLQSQGINVEYKPADTQLQFVAIAQGDLDFQVEVWEGSMAESYDKAVKSGAVEYGTHTAITREEWWYPTYMEAQCPGLPDWKALDACAEKFAVAETGTKGRFVGPPPDWGKHYSERIQALGMNFQEIPAGQYATILAELASAYERKEPIVIFNWTPNFVEAKFDGKFVEFPKYEPACLTDPKWGMNPDAIYDCGAPANGYLKKLGSKQLEEKWPKAATILKKIDFTNAQIASAAGLVDVEGLTAEAAADKWIEANKDSIKTWLE